jgi:hypothetical protein
MKLVIDIDALVANVAKQTVRGYDAAKQAAPTAKAITLSFKDRMAKAIEAGKKSARS